MLRGKYGVGATFLLPIIKAGVRDFAGSADWTPASGDVKLSKDGANVADITTLPTAVGGTGSKLWAFALSAAEMEAKTVTIQVVDQGTKLVEDQAFIVNNLPDGAISVGKAQSGSLTGMRLAAGEDYGGNVLGQGNAIVQIHGGAGRGQARGVLTHDNANDDITFDRDLATGFAVDNTSVYTLWPSTPAPTNAAALQEVILHSAKAGAMTYKRNSAITLFPFYMQLTTGGPGTGLTPTVVLSLDGAAFGSALAGVTEIGNGWYGVPIIQADTNADEILFHATATGCRPTPLKIRTHA